MKTLPLALLLLTIPTGPSLGAPDPIRVVFCQALLAAASGRYRFGELVSVRSRPSERHENGNLYQGRFLGFTGPDDDPKMRLLGADGNEFRVRLTHIDFEAAKPKTPVEIFRPFRRTDVIEVESVNGTYRRGNFLGFTAEGEIRFRLIEEIKEDGTRRIFPEGDGPTVILTLEGHDFEKKPPALVRKPQAPVNAARRGSFPEDRGFVEWPDHLRYLEKHGPKREQAVARAEKLVRDLDSILIDLREEMKKMDFSDPANRERVDRFLDKLFARLDDDSLLEGTGYEIHYRGVEMTMGKADIKYWIRTSEQLAEAAYAFARKTEVIPGRVIASECHQSYKDPKTGLDIPVSPRTPEDLNDRRIYVEQLLGTLEEHYHVAQFLRKYAGLTGPAANVSNWARNSGVDYIVDHEADVMAALMERFGPLKDFWRPRYGSRGAVPETLPLVAR